MNRLESLKSLTTVVADTGDIDAIRQSQPQDATTNPSLVYKAVQLASYRSLVESYKAKYSDVKVLADRLAVAIGAEISKVVPGRVSTEVDARLSFDTEATLLKARELVAMYAELGVDKSRILIKIAATWEGIRAAEILEKEGVNCNLTLIFSFAQAAACADAGVYLISPFVGRISDWYLSRQSEFSVFPPEQDPGVASVRRIYNYYKAQGYKTVVMGASFRNVMQIEALAGCDRLTISPQLLGELAAADGELKQVLSEQTAVSTDDARDLTESQFRWLHNEDAMATEKLAQGIQAFAVDQGKLEDLLAS